MYNKSKHKDKRDQISENQQQHRKFIRDWEKAIKKFSTPNIDFVENVEDKSIQNISKKDKETEPVEPIKPNKTSHLRNKSFSKKKSPLQKFDEVVTRELKKHRLHETTLNLYDKSKGRSNMNFTGGKLSNLGKSKLGFDTKASVTVVQALEKDVNDINKDPSQDDDPCLIDAIEKLAEAQALCQFNEAVRAAEEITTTVPPEMAEEAAVACARDYQSEILNKFHDEVPLTEIKKVVEVIGYIGITKPKEN